MEMQIFGSKYHILMIYQNGILFTLDIQRVRNTHGLALNLHQEHLLLNGKMLITIYQTNSLFMLLKINGTILIVEILDMLDLMLDKEPSPRMDLKRMKKIYLDTT